MAEIGELTARITVDTNQFNRGIENAGRKANSFGDGLRDVGKIAGGFLAASVVESGFSAITSGVNNSIDMFMSFEDNLANVRKTAGLTESEMRDVGDALLDMSRNTRTSAEELVNIATIGGQLGIAKGEILDFTESVNILNVALGDEFSGGAEQITSEMGKLANTLKGIPAETTSDKIMQIGNAINVLGSSGLATGPYISNVASRIATLTETAGLSAGDVLGLAATMEELGINAERGSSAMVRSFQIMAQNAGGFAEVAGLTGQEITDFIELVDTDAKQAFSVFLQGVNDQNYSMTEMASVLDNLQLKGVGTSELIQKLGGNTELMADKVLLGNEAIKGTSSVVDEYGVKSETTLARVEIAQNKFNAEMIKAGETLAPYKADLLNFATAVIPLVAGGIDDAAKGLEDFTARMAGGQSELKLTNKDLKDFQKQIEESGFTAERFGDDVTIVMAEVANKTMDADEAMQVFESEMLRTSVNSKRLRDIEGNLEPISEELKNEMIVAIQETNDKYGEFSKEASRELNLLRIEQGLGKKELAELQAEAINATYGKENIQEATGDLSQYNTLLRDTKAEVSGFSSFTSGIMDAASSQLTGIGINTQAGRATGGEVSAGMPYVVGERGPEVMIPGSNGSVMPNNIVNKSVSVGDVNINQNVEFMQFQNILEAAIL